MLSHCNSCSPINYEVYFNSSQIRFVHLTSKAFGDYIFDYSGPNVDNGVVYYCLSEHKRLLGLRDRPNSV